MKLTYIEKPGDLVKCLAIGIGYLLAQVITLATWIWLYTIILPHMPGMRELGPHKVGCDFSMTLENGKDHWKCVCDSISHTNYQMIPTGDGETFLSIFYFLCYMAVSIVLLCICAAIGDD